MSALPDLPVHTKSVFAQMSKLLGLRLDSERDVIRVVATGISTHAYRRAVGKLKFPAILVGPERTVRRRLASNSRFTAAESERIVRLTRVFAEVLQLFGNEEAALKWLNTPGNYVPKHIPVTPMTLAATDSGARLVESYIYRTAHGIY
jgi:putative toxin-antitoxin system antitoxin component (TIGR02293 family)